MFETNSGYTNGTIACSGSDQHEFYITLPLPFSINCIVFQILCAVLSQKRMFHQDELVRNYLAQASQRYADMRLQHHLQSDELERVFSPKTKKSESRTSSATKATQVSCSLSTFERKNTLLLTGKSKFYTMSYEDHCRTSTPAADRLSTNADQYCTTAIDNLSINTLANSVMMDADSPTNSANSRRSTSVDENLPRISNAASQREKLSFCVAEPFTESCHSWPYSDRNHNSIFHPDEARCQGAENCPHPVLPQAGNICSACFQAKRYSLVVQYPMVATKL